MAENGMAMDWKQFFAEQEAKLKPDPRLIQEELPRNELVTRLSFQKAICFGESPLDNVRSLRLMECRKCHKLIKHVAYAHHMRRHVSDHNVSSEDESQSFLLSPPRNRASSSLSYVSEQKNELLLVLKRTKMDSESEDFDQGTQLRSRTSSPTKAVDTKELTKLASLIDNKILDLRSYSRNQKLRKPRMLHPKSQPSVSQDSDCVAARTRHHLKQIESESSFETERVQEVDTKTKGKEQEFIEEDDDDDDCIIVNESKIEVYEQEIPYPSTSKFNCNEEDEDMGKSNSGSPVQSEFLKGLMADFEPEAVEAPISPRFHPPSPKPNVVRVIRAAQKPMSMAIIRPDGTIVRSSSRQSTPGTSNGWSEGSNHSDLPPPSPDMPQLEREDLGCHSSEIYSEPSSSNKQQIKRPPVYHIREKFDQRQKHQPVRHVDLYQGFQHFNEPQDFQYNYHYHQGIKYENSWRQISAPADSSWRQPNASRSKNVRLVPVSTAGVLHQKAPPMMGKLDPTRKYFLKPVNPVPVYKPAQPIRPNFVAQPLLKDQYPSQESLLLVKQNHR